MHSLASIIGAALAGKDQSNDHPKGERSKRGKGKRNFSKRLDLQCKRCGKTGHTSDQCWDSWDSIKDKHNQKKDDNKINMLVNTLIPLIVLLHIVILELMK